MALFPKLDDMLYALVTTVHLLGTLQRLCVILFCRTECVEHVEWLLFHQVDIVKS